MSNPPGGVLFDGRYREREETLMENNEKMTLPLPRKLHRQDFLVEGQLVETVHREADVPTEETGQRGDDPG